jgi:hypothetical protein
VTDLVKDYFVRTLSATEADALGLELRDSADTARRFALLAEQDYRRLGLPAPGTRDRGRKFWLLGAGFLLGAAASWAWFDHPWSVATERALAPAQEESFPEESPAPRHRPHRAELDEVAMPVAAPPTAIRPAKNISAPAAPAPLLRLLVSARSGGQLAFDIRLDGASAAARAQVLDRGGYVIRPLQTIAPSQWVWDGRDSNGRLVPKGNYCIQAIDADQKRVKWVKVEAR